MGQQPAPPSTASSSALVGFIAAGFALALVASWIAVIHEGSVTGLFLLGDRFSAPAFYERHLPSARIYADSDGYDGQFYLAMGLLPLSPAEAAVNFNNDNVVYRYRRILWSAAAHLLAFGQPYAVPWTMALLAIAAVSYGSAALASLARHFGWSPWWGLLFAFNGGTLIMLTRMTVDGIAAGLIMGAVAAWMVRRDLPRTILLLTAATLARETSLIFALALAADLALTPGAQPLERARGLLVILIVSTPLLLWHLFVTASAASALASIQASDPVGSNFRLPVYGWITTFIEGMNLALQHPFAPKPWLHLIHRLAFLAALVAAVALLLLRASSLLGSAHTTTIGASGTTDEHLRHPPDFILIGLLLTAMLGAAIGPAVWVEFWAYGRVLMLLPLLLAMEAMRSQRPALMMPAVVDALYAMLVVSSHLASEALGGG